MRATDVAAFLSRIHIPSVQHLLTGSLDSIRASIRATSAEKDPQTWVGLHVVLGTALRLRYPFMAEADRATACIEAVRAFECALAECCAYSSSRSLRSASLGTNQFSLQTSACAAGPDGVQMVVDATSQPFADGICMLESAVGLFTEAVEVADSRVDKREWVTARSNLGCALTLLGRRMPGLAGLPKIEQAIDVLSEAAYGCAADELPEERASACVNLAEAYQALAERSLPGERLRNLELSLSWMAAALGFFAAPQFQSLLQLERAGFA